MDWVPETSMTFACDFCMPKTPLPQLLLIFLRMENFLAMGMDFQVVGMEDTAGQTWLWLGLA